MEADRPALRITPEMIEAGLGGLYGWGPEWSGEGAVIEIYSAMEEARLRGRFTGSKPGKGGVGRRGPVITRRSQKLLAAVR